MTRTFIIFGLLSGLWLSADAQSSLPSPTASETVEAARGSGEGRRASRRMRAPATYSGLPEVPELLLRDGHQGARQRPAGVESLSYDSAGEQNEAIALDAEGIMSSAAAGKPALEDNIAWLTSPAPGATLQASQRFTWNQPAGAQAYWFWAGSCEFCADLADVDMARNTSLVVNLPSDPRFVYVTLWTYYQGEWWWRAYVFRTSAPAEPRPARMLSPANGERLQTQQRFTWDTGNAQAYYLYVGTCRGCVDILEEDMGRSTQRTINIPTGGRTIYVTLFSYISGDWYWNEYQYQGPTGGSGVRDVVLNITNRLVYPVNFIVNGTVVGSFPAGQTRTTTVRVSELRMSYVVTPPGSFGDNMSGEYSLITNPASRYDLTITNRIGDTSYFVPYITNRTAVPLLMEVNGGGSAQNRCNCTAPPFSNDVAIGYYRFYRNSNVRAYRNGSGYTGRYIFWGINSDGRGTEIRADADSGVARLNATSAP